MAHALPDDFPSNSSTNGVLAVGTSLTARFEHLYDSDWVKVNLIAGTSYVLSMPAQTQGMGVTSKFESVQLSLRGPDGAPLWDQSGFRHLGPAFEYTPKVSGTYYLSTQTFNPEENDLGSYSLSASIKPVGPDDFASDASTSGLLPAAGKVSGKFEFAGDVDWFRFRPEVGKYYAFGSDINAPFVYTGGMKIFDSAGAEYPIYPFTTSVTRDYFVAVGSYEPGPYSIFSRTLPTDDYADDMRTTGLLRPGTELTGGIQFRLDVDYFKTTLAVGQTYAFELSAHELDISGLGVMVLNAEGKYFLVSTSPPNAGKMLFTFTPSATGDYFFAINGDQLFSGTTRSPYTVKMAVPAVPPPTPTDDFGDTAATAGRLTEKVPLHGQLALNDRDSFKLNVVAGDSYVIEVVIPASGESIPLVVQDAAGESRPHSMVGWPQPGNHYLVFYAATPGEHLVTLDGRSGYPTGAYSITAYSAGQDDFGSSSGTAGTLPVDGKTSGKVEHRFDEDWFRVNLTAGKSYVFELRGSTQNGGTLSTSDGSLFRLLLPDGESAGVPMQIDSSSPRIQFTAQETRDYYLEVSGRVLNTGSYTVMATEIIGDTAAPTLVSQSLAQGGDVVSLTADLVLTFNEAVRVPFNNIKLRDSSGALVTLDDRDLMQGLYGISNKVVVDPIVTLRPGTTYTLDIPDGSVLDRVGNPYVGVKSFSFTTMTISSAPGVGNDLFAGVGRGSSISGGAGIDTVVYSETLASYQIGRSNGSATVSHSTSPVGDALSSIERLLFADFAVALDIGGAAGQAYRLYQAAFDRVPDKDGLGYWIAQMDGGMSLGKVASNFVGSDEFKTLYGTAPTNAQFVDLLYDNVLHRKGDQAGIDFWVSSLAAGARRDDMLASFSESAENQAALAVIIGNGFIYNPYG